MRRISQHLWNGHEEKEMEKNTHTYFSLHKWRDDGNDFVMYSAEYIHCVIFHTPYELSARKVFVKWAKTFTIKMTTTSTIFFLLLLRSTRKNEQTNIDWEKNWGGKICINVVQTISMAWSLFSVL